MKTSFLITDYGAVGDGETENAAAIQACIEACAAACETSGRGGIVTVPAGVFATGTIRLRSGVTLVLEAGATLRGSSDPGRYSGCRQQGKMSARWFHALILAEDTEDAGVVGPGKIDGAKVHDPVGEERMRGPHTIIPAHSKRFTIRDITIVDSANYAVLVVNSDDTDIHNITVYGGWDGVHARGNPELSCQRLTITNSRFFTGDDAIAGCWVDDLLVYNCVLNSSCNGFRWIGPAKRMTIDNCLIEGPGREPHRTQGRHNALIGITFQPSAWEPMPGDSDDIRISNIRMHNVLCPLMVVAHPPNRIGTIDISRVTATGVYGTPCTFESWSDEAIDRVSIRDCDFNYAYKTGVDVNLGAGVDRTDLQEIKRPHVGSRMLPVWGLYAYRVAELELQGVRINGGPAMGDMGSVPGVEGGVSEGERSDLYETYPVLRLDGVERFECDALSLPGWVEEDSAVERRDVMAESDA